MEKFLEADSFAMSQAFEYIERKPFAPNSGKTATRGWTRLSGFAPDLLRSRHAARAHGSAIFQRGETQAVALATLAPSEEAQRLMPTAAANNKEVHSALQLPEFLRG